MRQCIDLTHFAKCHQDSINLIRGDLIHNRPVVCKIRTFVIKSYSLFRSGQSPAMNKGQAACWMITSGRHPDKNIPHTRSTESTERTFGYVHYVHGGC